MTEITREAKRHIRSNYKKKRLNVIAQELGLKPSEVYAAAKTMGIRLKRRWLPEEDDYLRDAIDRLSVRSIAKNLFRTPSAIYKRIRELNLEIQKNEFNIKAICRRIGIGNHVLYNAVKSGKLRVHGRDVTGSKSYIVDLNDVREYMVKHQHLRMCRCYQCGEAAHGDIFCKKHEFVLDKIKHHLPTTHVIRCETVEQSYRDLGGALAEVRRVEGVSQKEISARCQYHERWYGNIERGDKRQFALDVMIEVLQALGYKMSIQIEKIQK